MQTITTKFIGQTDTKPARIKAITSSGISITVCRDSKIECIIDDYKRVAKMLVKKLDWNWCGKAFGGRLNEDSFVWLCASGDAEQF